MSDARRDRLAGLLAEAATRFGVTLDGEPVRGAYDRTLAVRTSGPAWLRVTAQPPEWARGEIWDGNATATGEPFGDLPMPRHLRSAEWVARWDDVDQVVRADLMTFVDRRCRGIGMSPNGSPVAVAMPSQISPRAHSGGWAVTRSHAGPDVRTARVRS